MTGRTHDDLKPSGTVLEKVNQSASSVLQAFDGVLADGPRLPTDHVSSQCRPTTSRIPPMQKFFTNPLRGQVSAKVGVDYQLNGHTDS